MSNPLQISKNTRKRLRNNNNNNNTALSVPNYGNMNIAPDPQSITDLLDQTTTTTDSSINTHTHTDNNILEDMLSKQSSLFNNNLAHGLDPNVQKYYEIAIDDNSDQEQQQQQHDDDDNDDDLIFLKQQPVLGFRSYSYNPIKKQRTISLPQLPHVKLNYLNNTLPLDDTSSKIDQTAATTAQNDNDLLYLTGSSALTLEGNRKIKLNKIWNNHDNTTPAAPTSKSFQTDKDGHYIFQMDDCFGPNGNQFKSLQLLGQGTFGKVLKCLDTYTNQFVAVKIIRSIDRYREAAKTELRILSTILQNDPTGQFQCLLLKDYFDYKDHICLVTNLYGKSVYDFMCSNGIARFPGSHIQAIARQLIRSTCFLHDLGIIHTDLKPENILLCDESFNEYQLPPDIVETLSTRRKLASNNGMRKILKNPEIKIIDFGSAIFVNEYHPPVISTRHYRAPEIVLGLGWSYPCDIWSIACILIELVLGESLYPIHENFEHLAMMERINGERIPAKLIEKSFYKYKHKLGNLPQDLNSTVLKHFDKNSCQLVWPEINKRTGETITPLKSIKRVMNSCDRLDMMVSKILKMDYDNKHFSINWNLTPQQNWNLIKGSLYSRRSNNSIHSNNQYHIDRETFLFWYWFVDLMRKMFEFDPTKRISAKEALNHEWFNLGILDDGISNFESNSFNSPIIN